MSLHLREVLGDELERLGLDGEPFVELDADARRARAERVTGKLIDELAVSGPDRAALVAAIGSSLQMAIGVCGDRRDALARGVLDAILNELRVRTR